MSDELLKPFAFEDFSPEQRIVAAPFALQAELMIKRIEPKPEREAALQKLLEARDAAIAAVAAR